MRASGAIATAATHGARHSESVADRQTWQVACQVAVKKGLLSAAQQRRRRRPLTLTVHRPRPRAAVKRQDEAENVAQAPRE